MSKLQNKMLASQILILAGLFTAVWQLADYVSHHWVRAYFSVQGGFHWMGWPGYQFDWIMLIYPIMFLGVGIWWQIDCKKSGFRWHRSQRASKRWKKVGNWSAVWAIYVSIFVLCGWVIARGSGHYNSMNVWVPTWTVSMWWSIAIGWLAVASVFCFIQRRRLLPRPTFVELTEEALLERYKDVSTKDLVRMKDGISIVLVHRQLSTRDPETLNAIHRSLLGRSPTSV